MKKMAILMMALGGLMSGCIAVPVEDGRGYHQQRGYYERDGQRSYNYDRDRDGVPNSQDRRPDDPRRY